MEDSFLTLKHYKEPLLPVKKGFGYYGAIAISRKDGRIQCHICGNLFGNLGLHLYHQHEITVTGYKEKFKLSRSTALISEEVRMKMKEQALEMFRNMTQEEREKRARRARAGCKKGSRVRLGSSLKERLEAKNKKGTCPDQLLETIKKCAEVLGHTPTKNEFIGYYNSQRYVHLIYKTFGSWGKAIEMANLSSEPRTPNTRKRYSDEELLDYLSIYWSENGRVPTETDCRRGLIPGSWLYRRRFGSLPKARKLAGIEERTSRWKTLPRKFKDYQPTK